MTNQREQAPGDDRFDAAQAVARSAGALALDYFRRAETLVVEHKGSQDLVSEADRETERHIRQELQSAFPVDAFMGEEHGYTEGSPGDGTWVVDPIDGTQPFLLGLPTWCISIAYVADNRAQIGVIYNPATDELYCAQAGVGGVRQWCTNSRSTSRFARRRLDGRRLLTANHSRAPRRHHAQPSTARRDVPAHRIGRPQPRLRRRR